MTVNPQAAEALFYEQYQSDADPNIPYPAFKNYLLWLETERVRLGFNRQKQPKLGKKAARKAR